MNCKLILVGLEMQVLERLILVSLFWSVIEMKVVQPVIEVIHSTASPYTTNVINGMRFQRGEFSLMVALFFTDKASPKYFCSGSLVSSNHVVTGEFRT